MTTITFKDNVMAADSCINGAYLDQLSADKIYLIDNHLVGCAGELVAIKKFLSYIENGWRNHDIPKKSRYEFEALVYSIEERQLYYYDNSYMGLEVGVPAAVGSGQAFAMGALMAGADAAEAVNISKKLDPFTNGDVKTYRIEEEGGLEDATPERIAALEDRLEKILHSAEHDAKPNKKKKNKKKKNSDGKNAKEA